uniref:Putative ovule protein n=1 Tax=Solanum chacoense TaxID=4108 RepID=A0A0V0H3A7_SOLCH
MKDYILVNHITTRHLSYSYIFQTFKKQRGVERKDTNFGSKHIHVEKLSCSRFNRVGLLFSY